MDILELKSLNQIEFAKELKTFQINQDLMKFLLNDSLMQNIDVFFYYMNYKKVKKIMFLRPNYEPDILAVKKFAVYIKKYFKKINSDFFLMFEKFTHEELYNLLGEKNYLLYCSNVNIDSYWNQEDLKKEKEKIENNRHLLKYETFNYIVKKQENMPYSMLNIPSQSDVERFVFHFNCYNEKIKNLALEMIEEIKNIEKKQEKYYNSKLEYAYIKIKNLIQTNKIHEEIYYYAFGFLYKDEKLSRISLYTKFTSNMLSEKKIQKFIKDKHNVDIENKLNNVWHYGIDFYEDREEIKIYDEPFIFKEKIENLTIYNLLKDKRCIKVIKYDNLNNKIDEKYEFNRDVFNENEMKILEEGNLFSKKHRVFSIYLKDKKIVKNVKYDF